MSTQTRARSRTRDRGPRVALVSLHTSPADQPGTGDAGGMNVYVREAAAWLGRHGVDVDIFTRRRTWRERDVQELGEGSRLIRVDAGPRGPMPKHDLPRVLPEFLDGIVRRARRDRRTYDLVHAHYWLSGAVGRDVKERWRVPLVSSFHTLGRVKNEALAGEEEAEPDVRVQGEASVIAASDRILAATPVEAAQLVEHYGADPDRVRVVPPGVDHDVFKPRPRREARARLHLADVRLVLFVGRLQAHKGPDVAVRTIAEAIAMDPEAMRDVMFAIVGGPSGSGIGADVARLMDLATALGVADRVILFPPQPHERLADFYAAAEAVLVPSRSESFGLVAAEALSCGTPVVAAAVGGLRHVVRDGVDGYLVAGHDPGAHARRLLAILRDPARAEAMGREAVVDAERFSWHRTGTGIFAVYSELLQPTGA